MVYSNKMDPDFSKNRTKTCENILYPAQNSPPQIHQQNQRVKMMHATTADQRHCSGPFRSRRWTPFNTVVMILGFVLFWPLGLAMLAYIVWGDRMTGKLATARDKMDGFNAKFSREGRPQHHRHYSTGNTAFDDYRNAELARLEEERRKLNEMRAEFDEFVDNVRRAKDQKEFDKFMASRDASE